MDDHSDTFIEFDAQGQCNYCTKAIQEMDRYYFPNAEGERKLGQMLDHMREAGRNAKYDCIMGLSGGLDSSYLAYMGHKWGLRVLAVHIDDGFDSDISKRNLANIVKATGFDYVTISPDAAQFADLTRSHMLAGVPNLAVPQDNVLFAFLYHKTKEHGIKYFASGGNYALESVLQKGNTYTSLDVVNIKDIHKLFGRGSINKLKLISSLSLALDAALRGMKTVRPLDLIEYNRNRAFEELHEFCGFEYYGRKHLENKLTEFIQLYWFYHKFDVDKRTSHLSSLIVSGQITRQEAIEELAKPIYTEPEMDSCVALVRSRLGLSESELQTIMDSPGRPHEDYRTQEETLRYKGYRAVHRLLRNSRLARRWTRS